MRNIFLVVTLIISFSGFAGPGHSHSHGHSHGHGHSKALKAVTKEKTKELGRFHVNRLIKSGKIGATWNSSTYDKSEKKQFGNKTEWVVTFDNELGVKGKKLYIFLNLAGEFVAANFSGK